MSKNYRPVRHAKKANRRKNRHAVKLVLAGAGAALATSVYAGPLPVNGTITSGTGNISTSGTAMTITQNDPKMIVTWDDFSIDAGHSVEFQQPSTSAAALNRVLGASVSEIHGSLTANGQVFLVNPNGVLFGGGAQVDVGGLVASTLDISDADFLADTYTFSGASTEAITNQGTIDAATGGAVALIAAQIVNEGDITAPGGDVLMGAGSEVTLDLGGPASLEVETAVLDAMIENGGAIRAQGGTILLTARAANTLTGAAINATGIMEARSMVAADDGVITLLGENGSVDVDGKLDAKSVRIQASNRINWKENASLGDGNTSLAAGVDNHGGAGDGLLLDADLNAGTGALSASIDANVKIGAGKTVNIDANGGNVLFGRWIDSDAPGLADAGTLKITAGDGRVLFASMVGSVNPLDALYVTTSGNGRIYIGGDLVRTHNEQIYDGPVELGRAQFENPDFANGMEGWDVLLERVYAGTSEIAGWDMPEDDTYHPNNANRGLGDTVDATRWGNAPDDLVLMTLLEDDGSGRGDSLRLVLEHSEITGDDARCAVGYCVLRGPVVVSESAVALESGENVAFDWSAVAGGDAYDAFGYLLNVITGEAQIILNDTGSASTGWVTTDVTVEKGGLYKFVFVSGSYDANGARGLGGSLLVDNIAKTSPTLPKVLEASQAQFLSTVDTASNDVTIKADEIDFLGGPGSVGGGGRIALENRDPSVKIDIGGPASGGGEPAGDGALQLSSRDVEALADGFDFVRIGDADMTGDIDVTGDARFYDNLILDAGTGGMNIGAGLTARDPGAGHPDNNPDDDVDEPLIEMRTDGGTVTQTADGVLDGHGLVLTGTGATYELDTADNLIGELATETGSVAYGVGGGIGVTVGTLTTAEGNTYSGLINETDSRLTADEIDITEPVRTTDGTGVLVLKQRTPGLDIHVGGADDDESVGGGDPLRLSASDLDFIDDGFARLVIGDGNAGDVTVDSAGYSFKDDLELNAGGAVDLQGNLTLADVPDAAHDDGNPMMLRVNAGGGMSGPGVLTADKLALTGDGLFALGDNAHNVDELAGDVDSLRFLGAGDLTVGTVDGLDGITSDEAVTLSSPGDLHLASGILIENGPDDGPGAGDTRTDDIITLDVAGTATQAAAGAGLDAYGLALLGGAYDLGGTGNRIDVIASDAGEMHFDGTADLTVGTLTATGADGSPQTLTGIENTGDVSIGTQGNLSIAEKITLAGHNLFLDVTGTATQAAVTGALEVAGLAVTGGTYLLDTASNWIGTFASRAGTVHLLNQGMLIVDTLTQYEVGSGTLLDQIIGVGNSGKTHIATYVDDLDIRQDVASASGAGDALVLNAHQAKDAGDAAGGNVLLAPGVELSVGAGGSGLVYSGSMAGSTGLIDAVGTGSGKFRYGSDEAQTNYTSPIGTGIHGIYREKPVITVSTNDNTVLTKVEDGNVTFDGGGIDAVDVDGLLNGDEKGMLGAPVFSVGSSEPGEYQIRISGLQGLGYEVVSSADNALLTVTPAPEPQETITPEPSQVNVSKVTTEGAGQSETHFPDMPANTPETGENGGGGRTSGGLFLVDADEEPAPPDSGQLTGTEGGPAQGNQAQGNAGPDTGNGDDGQDSGSGGDEGDDGELGRLLCEDGGESGASTCAAMPPQTVFVVRGGIRVPVSIETE